MTGAEISELHRSCGNYTAVVDEIVRMEKKVFPKHESLATTFHQALAKNNSGLIFAHLDGEVAGYVMYCWPSSLSGAVTKLAVKEKYRRRGYGEKLLKAAIEKCRTRNIHRISLHVDPTRNPALNLYKRLGFRIDSLIEQYYSHDRDAYRMCLDFDVGA
ncbi:hypothetical protein Drorol1_Dr00003107 [Drosera rotundifolia]